MPICFLYSSQGLPSVCEFSAFRHFFKTNVAQSVAELIIYLQKTQNTVIFYKILGTKIECKQHFHDKMGFRIFDHSNFVRLLWYIKPKNILSL